MYFTCILNLFLKQNFFIYYEKGKCYVLKNKLKTVLHILQSRFGFNKKTAVIILLYF